jgi:hypothetical protein
VPDRAQAIEKARRHRLVIGVGELRVDASVFGSVQVNAVVSTQSAASSPFECDPAQVAEDREGSMSKARASPQKSLRSLTCRLSMYSMPAHHGGPWKAPHP